MQRYDLTWIRDSTGERHTCLGLEPRTLVARLVNLLRHERSVTIEKLTPWTAEDMGPGT